MLHVPAKVFHHDFGLLFDVVRMQRHKLCQSPHTFFLRKIWIVFRLFHEPVEGLIRGVILQDIENETLLNRLAHTVEMECFRLSRSARAAEELQRLSFWRRRECEETQVWLSSARLHH